MLVKGDKIKLVNPMGMFTNVGEVCEVIDVSDGIISFKFGNGMHMGCMSPDEFTKYFEKYEEPKTTKFVDMERVEDIMEHSKIIVHKVFDKCTVVACKLPSGFVIVESSACVYPDDYDEEMGIDICLNRIMDKISEMEAYRIQNEMWEEGNSGCDGCRCDCCDCEDCHCDDEDDEDDDFWEDDTE